MRKSFTIQWVHIIFATKDRQPLLNDKSVREQVFAYIAGICRDMKSPANIVGGMPDHVHVLCNQSKQIALMDLVRHIKQGSSKWIKSRWEELPGFQWQNGYAGFNVSPSHVYKVSDYIANQEKHHEKGGSKTELASLLERAEIPYDPRDIF